MDNIQQLLKQQADLAKRISDAYGAEATHKARIKDIFAESVRKKQRGMRFINALGKMQDDKIKSALANAGWQISTLTGNIQSGKSEWIKKDSSMKLTIDAGTWTIKNGTETVAGPSPLADLPEYLSRPVTTPIAARK